MKKRKRYVVGSGWTSCDGGLYFKIGDWTEDAYCLIGEIPSGKYRLILERLPSKRGGKSIE